MEIGCNGALPSFKALIEELRKCAMLRNAVVHAEWENMNEDGYTYVKLSFDKNGLQQHYIQFTPEALKGIDQLFKATISKFDLFTDEKQQLLSN